MAQIVPTLTETTAETIPIIRTLLSLLIFIISALGASGAPSPASGVKAAPGYKIRNFAIKFACCNGPLGLAFNSQDRLFVADNADGRIYTFGPKGGAAGNPVNRKPIRGSIDGLAFGRDGSLYLARYRRGDVVQIDPKTGKILRVLIRGVACAGGLAVDPLSGDLFLSQPGCTADILRVLHPHSCGTVCTVVKYATPGGTDGMTFSPDGILYTQTNGCAYRLSATNISPTTATQIACPNNAMDGIALSPTADPRRPLLFANGNNGTIVKIDQSQSPATISTIMRGGTRGDFVTVGPDGCLYATQSTSIVRISNAHGTCSWTPAGVVPELHLAPNRHASIRTGAFTSFTVTLVNAQISTNTKITFTVSGANTKKKYAQLTAAGTATLRYRGRMTGQDHVVARALLGKRRLRSNPGMVLWVH